MLTCSPLGAQFTTVSATDGCTCDGSFTFINPISGSATYTLMDNLGNQVVQQTNGFGIFNTNNLCASVFVLNVTNGAATETYIVNIPTVASNIGTSAIEHLCSTDGTMPLLSFLTNPIAGGTWTNPVGLATGNTISPPNAIEGTYTYSILIGGCSVETGVYIEIIENANPGFSSTYVICDFYLPFEMITFMAGSPDPNGQWYDTQGNPMNGWYDPSAMSSASFVYSIDSVAGCSPVFSVMTIDENITPDPGLDATVLVCSNGSSFNMTSYLGGTPDLGGQWFDDANQPVPALFNPAAMPAGVYRYHLDGQAPCSDQNAFLTINFSSDNPSGESATYEVCETGGIINMLFALGGNPQPGGEWTNEQGQVVSNIFNPSIHPAGIYSYYFPNVGCTPGNAELNIAVESLPNSGADGQAVICETIVSYNLDTMLSLDADSDGIWTDGSNNVITPIQNGFAASSYTFYYITQGIICPDNSAIFNITVESAVSAPGNTSFSICEDSNPIDLNDLYSLSGLQFLNAQGQSMANLFDPSVMNDMIITVVSESSNSCPDATSQIIADVEPYAFTSGADQANACTSESTFDLNSTSANIDFNQGAWTNTSGIAISNLVNLLGTTSQTFIFTSNTQQLCTASEFQFTLNIFEPIEAGQNESYIFCTTDNAQLLTDLLPSSASGLGDWEFGGLPYVSSAFDPQFNTGGIYQYVVPANGPCPADFAELNIILQDGITYSAGNDVSLCSGTSIVEIGQDNPIDCNFSWSPAQDLDNANAPLVHPDIGNPTVVPVTYEYTVVVSDNVCLAYDTVLVTLFPIPQPTLNNIYEICDEETITINAGTEGTYDWSPANFFPDQALTVQTISPDNDVTIVLSVTNEWDCLAIDTSQIIVHPLPQPSIQTEAISSCPPAQVIWWLTEESENCDVVQWQLDGIGTFAGDSLSLLVLDEGLYTATVQVNTIFGCSTMVSIEDVITVFPTPNADFEWSPHDLTTINATAYFENTSTGAVDYAWNFADLDTSSSIHSSYTFPQADPSNYEVCLLAINEYGCSDSHCSILHLDNEYIFYAPSAFTPDYDGINDVFYTVLDGFDMSTFTLMVADRWGDIIFETNDPDMPWTGNVHGGNYYAQPDVYQWQVTVKDREKAEYRMYNGHVTLIR